MMTAPTHGWSSTQRVATLAMLAPPWRSPMARSTARSAWNSGQSPHAFTIMSRYCAAVSVALHRRCTTERRTHLALRRCQVSGVQVGLGRTEPLVGEEATALRKAGHQ